MSAIRTISLPSHWWMVRPCGCIDGSMISVRNDGTIVAADAEQAWAKFTPIKRSRDKEAREGWVVRGVTPDEFARFGELMTARCEHEAVKP